MRPPDSPFAPAAKLLLETLGGVLPPELISVADWAQDRRWVKSPRGTHLSRWAHETAPYLVGPMEALSDEDISTVPIVGPAGCGKTMTAENWLLRTIDTDPSDFLWYGPTDPLIEAYVKQRIEPMLEHHEALIGARRAGLGRDSVSFKRFLGMSAQFLTFTGSNLTNKHVACIVCDEVDACDPNMGDPATVLNYRRRAAGAGSKLCLISHPDRATGLNPLTDWQGGIMSAYADSDRRTWWWQCQDCGEYSSPNPGTSRHMVLTFSETAPLDVVAAEARLLCPVCGVLLDERQRRTMLRGGKWLCEGQTIDDQGRIHGERRPNPSAGFWIVGAMNAFMPDGIGGMAREREKARRESEISGDDKALKQVMVKGWGIPYQPPRKVGTIEASELAERVETGLKLGEVPEWVRLITASVDNQGNRFELLARGWGPEMESVILDKRVIPAEPATSPEDWDRLVELLAGLAYPLADGSGRMMRVRCAVYDVVGEAGVTEQAYAVWLRARRKGLVRRVGQIRGRDAWTLLPARGASRPQAPRISLSYPDRKRSDRHAAAQGDIPLLVFNPNQAKDALAAQLGRAEDGKGAIHFPAGLIRPPAEPGGPPDLSEFEQLVAERRDAKGNWGKIRPSARNENIDLMTMSESAARLFGVHRIDWNRPPAWAAPWDSNTMVGMPAVAPERAAVSLVPPVSAGVLQAAGGVGRRLASMLP